MHTHTQILSLSLSHTQSLFLTHTHTHTHRHTHYLSLSHTHSLTHSSSTSYMRSSTPRWPSPWTFDCHPVSRSILISHKVFLKSFCRSQLPHKSVNLSFTITHTKNKLKNLYGN